MNRFVRVLILLAMLAALVAPMGTAQASEQPEGQSVYIIRLWDSAAASYTGGIVDLAATSPQAIGERKLDVDSPATAAYVDYLAGKQADLISGMELLLGRSLNVKFQYLYAYNGMAVELSASEARLVGGMPGVRSIQIDVEYEMDTDVGPYLIGADDIWNTDFLPGDFEQGEGVIIGMIDSGINHAHASFADVGGDGYDHTNPKGSGNYFGWCATNPSFCNDKLIGAYNFYTVGATPEDTDGHGSHTASTAGGNRHEVLFQGVTRTIQGVAPHANIIAYKVCDPGCPSSASVAAVNQGIANGVDVFNFSISGGSNPWNDSVDQAFLDATAAGIFVSASAGNAGPGAGTVAHNGPWNATVAASTHSRIFANTVDVTAPTPVPPELQGMAAIPGADVTIGTDIVDDIAYEAGNLNGCNAFTGSLTGMIALIQRGTCSFSIKVNNAQAAGAVAAVIFNNAGGPPITMGHDEGIPFVIPAVMITMDDGLALQDYIDNNTGEQVRINSKVGAVEDPAYADIMADFSSRGPTPFELLKPDYTAPGVEILAAVAGGAGQYDLYQGTSMSSPHSAGAAALMIGIHGDWTIPEIRSAMTMGADPNVLDTGAATPADPYDFGSGRLDLGVASMMGLVMDETIDNYEDANPATGGDPSTLNQPSMVNNDCVGVCSWERRFTSVLTDTQAWTVVANTPAEFDVTVTPNSFTLDPGETITLTIEATVLGGSQGDVVYGDIVLTPTSAPTVSAARLPVLIVLSVPDAAQIVIDPTSLESTQPPVETVQELTISNSGEMPLDWELYDGTPVAPMVPFANWAENFDGYAAGSQIHGQGGWKGWGNDPTYGALVSDAQARSADNSVAIADASDLVHEYTGYTTGTWRYTAWQYIPSGATGETYFILLNQYDDAQTTLNWSLEIAFDLDADTVTNTGPAGGTLPVIRGQWVPIVVDIDLNNDVQTVYYGGDLLFTGSWTEGNSGGGILNIGAVDLYANGADPVYYDDISLTEVWADNFDSYTVGSQMHGQGGWKGWANDPAAGALVSSLYAHTTANSVEIVGASDLVHEYSGYTSGVWEYTAWQYIPTGATGETYFILLNQYDDAGTTNNWSTQVDFNLTTNTVINTGLGGETLPVIRDEWVQIRVVIDLVNDTQNFYYGADLLFTDSWTEGNSGGGILNIAAVDLFANNAAAVYYDTMSLAPYVEDVEPSACDLPGDIPWLSTDPISGTTEGGASSLVDVYLDATSLLAGVYTATLCVESNSAVDPLIEVPVTLEVVDFVYGVTLTPATDEQTGMPGDVLTYTLSVENTGNYTDSFDLSYAGNLWDVTLSDTSVELAAGESTDVIVNVTIPTDTVGGGADVVTIEAVSVGDDTKSDSSVLTSSVAEVYGVELTPETDAMAGDPGEVVAYTLTVANLGNITDTFDLSVTGNAWDVQFEAVSVTLGAGEAADLMVDVTIPAEALAGEFDVATIAATSQGDDTVSDSSVLTTTVNVVYGVEIAPATSAFTDTAGTVVPYTLTITNLGNVTDTFMISYTDNTWTVSLPFTTTELAAGESVELVVLVSIPANAADGAHDMATITVTSESDAEVTAEAELHTTAIVTGPEVFNIFLPIVAREP